MSSSRSQLVTIEDDFGDERVVLCTTDEAFFRLMKRDLAGGSNIFKTLFQTEEAQPLNATVSLEKKVATADSGSILSLLKEKAADGLPIIRVSVDGRTLDVLLQLLYGIVANGSPERKIRDIDGVKGVLLFAHKYGFTSIADLFCEQLLSDLPSFFPYDSETDAEADIYALRVYALACRLRRVALAEAAAHQTLRGRVTPVAGHSEAATFPELQELPALDYHRLQDYHARSGEAVARVFELEEEGEDCGMPAEYSELTRCADCSFNSGNGKGKAAWWQNYVSRAAKVVREVPRSQRIFSSEFLKEAYNVAEDCKGDCCTQIDARWLALSLILKERIESALGKVFPSL